MLGFLYGALAWALTGLIPMILVGAGMSLVVYTFVEPMIEGLLNDSAAAIGGLPEIAAQLILLSGVGESMSILGSALLTRVAITMASNVAGLKMNN